MNKPRVIVIGGGIIGATIAANLTVQGLQVSLLEKETVGGNGATKFSGALFRLYDPDREIARLARTSIELMENSLVGKAFAQSLRRCGILYACEKSQFNDDSISRCITQYSDDLYPMRLVSQDVASDISHGCYSKENVRTLLYEAKGGFGDVRKAARDLSHLVQSYGNLVLENTQVDEIGSTPTGAFARCGDYHLQADYLVLAAGAWSRQLVKHLPIETRSIPLASLSTARESPLPIIDTQTGTHIIPLNGGFYQAGSKIRASASEPESLRYATELIIPDILERLSGSKLMHIPTDVVSVLKGFDSYTADGRPIIDFVDEYQRCMGIAGFCGIGYKIALAVAERVKNTLLSEATKGSLPNTQMAGIFSASRFPSQEGCHE
ncbi:NAD(P)/FAD-dependent oxidoreductase [Serratia oryzae]|uniref:NAD(P)/FAD-dependent oxidoreductase n=1 Tax=Serratia oryzae TaxID=2034155 RepID=UPI0018CF3F0E|nr:FAD-dependent oxidoreductase [Serratia oryzae]